MPTHEVSLNIASDIPVGNRDIVIPVKADGTPLGRLKVSKGGVEWLPSPNSRSSYTMTWQRLAEVMEGHGRKKPRR